MRIERVQKFRMWTKDEDIILWDLMSKGASMEEKSSALPSRTVDAIKRRQDRLRHPEGPGQRGGRKPPTGNPVGRPKKGAIIVADPNEEPFTEDDIIKPKVHSVRKCLTCGAPFTSEGPHNRLCPTHRAGSYGMEYTIRFR